MTHLLDVNVLIALAWPQHVHHAAATEWFGAAHLNGWATTPVTESGFIRVSSNPRVFPDGVTPGQAAELLVRYRLVPGHEFWVDDLSMAEVAVSVDAHVWGSSMVSDAHLAFLAVRRGGTLTTFDRRAGDLARALGADVALLA